MKQRHQHLVTATVSTLVSVIAVLLVAIRLVHRPMRVRLAVD